MISSFYNGSSFEPIYEVIEEFSKGNYQEVLQADPAFDKNEDLIVYNLICIDSSLKISNEIP
ncbi:MAG: hypothetical protein GYA35_05360, partial [Thermoanaerobaculaceae bacterium]|nr:hypothetical protein [Thermoanaerobaculaceae bacterium]